MVCELLVSYNTHSTPYFERTATTPKSRTTTPPHEPPKHQPRGWARLRIRYY